MPPIHVRAHFDGESIRLDEPILLPVDVPLIVTVSSLSTDYVSEIYWAQLSAERLNRAYSDNEPEYSEADLRT